MTDRTALLAACRTLLELHEKATPGPWKGRTIADDIAIALAGEPAPPHVVREYRDGKDRRCTAFVATCDGANLANEHNAALIAHARNHAPDLARAVVELVEEATGCASALQTEKNISGSLNKKVADYRVELDAALDKLAAVEKELADSEASRQNYIAEFHRVEVENDGLTSKLAVAEAALEEIESGAPLVHYPLSNDFSEDGRYAYPARITALKNHATEALATIRKADTK